jgi:hypothetical protein
MFTIDYSLLFLILLVVLVLYTFFVYVTTRRNQVVNGITPLSPLQTIATDNLLTPSSINIYYDMWLFLGTGATGDILKRQREIQVSIDAANTLKIQDAYSQSVFNDVSLANFPRSKWVFLTVQINQLIGEVYVNGKLLKTFALKQLLQIVKTNTFIALYWA